MTERIQNELKKIEHNENVKILYAVESGSRAWGFPSKDSDYDVRFIYIREPARYLTIEEERDVLEYPINDLLDFSGWDIRKALKLFRKSNPPLSEWMISPIVYQQSSSFIEKLRGLQSEYFSPKSCAWHYLSMAKGNFREYLKGEQVKIKKYFYVLRPVLACLWIEQKNEMPPMEFRDLLELIKGDALLVGEIHELLRKKESGDELDLQPVIKPINEFLERELQELEEKANEMKAPARPPREPLDQLFRDMLDEVWGLQVWPL